MQGGHQPGASARLSRTSGFIHISLIMPRRRKLGRHHPARTWVAGQDIIIIGWIKLTVQLGAKEMLVLLFRYSTPVLMQGSKGKVVGRQSDIQDITLILTSLPLDILLHTNLPYIVAPCLSLANKDMGCLPKEQGLRMAQAS